MSHGDILVACARRDDLLPYESLLAAEDRESAGHLPAGRAREFRAGRTLLRWALRRRLGGWALACRVGTTERGKPYLTDAPNTGVSVSHGGGIVAVAVAPGRAVGIDTEPPVRPTPALVRRCCSAGQSTELEALPDGRRAAALARCWTVHEACAKATGRGLTQRFAAYPGPLLADAGRWGALGWQALPAVAGCAVTVAYGTPTPAPWIRLAVPDPTDLLEARPHAALSPQ